MITIWGAVVFLLDLGWAKFNHCRYFQHNRRQIKPIALKIQHLSWSEAMLEPSCPQVTPLSQTVTQPFIYVNPRLASFRAALEEDTPPARLLSEAVLLAAGGRRESAASLLRLVINHPHSSWITKQAAAVRLARILHSHGQVRLAAEMFFYYTSKGVQEFYESEKSGAGA